MSHRVPIAVLGALLLALGGAAPAQAGAPSLSQETGNPINDQGSSYNYRSYVTSVVPRVPGLSLQVLEFADRLILTNRSGQTVTVFGYQGEPYARVLANGTVQLNTHSPAYYLNQNFYGNVTVPPSASPTASPRWTVIDRTGQLEWHDHRIHWMSPLLPPQVTNKSKRTKVFDWQVPIQVGARKGTIDGDLFWTPEADSKAPLAAIAALVAILLAAVLIVAARPAPARRRSAPRCPRRRAAPRRARAAGERGLVARWRQVPARSAAARPAPARPASSRAGPAGPVPARAGPAGPASARRGPAGPASARRGPAGPASARSGSPRRPPLARAGTRVGGLRWVLQALTLAAAALLASAAPAGAHAQLLGTSPAAGATVPTQPREVIFQFNQDVGGTLGAVRVYDAQGAEVDNLEVSHPDGQEHWMGVGLKAGLPDGTYTATYRVVSADTHKVYRGLVFNIGHPGAAPRITVAGQIARGRSGPVTALAFGLVRALDYLAIALLLGGLAFAWLAWRPGLAAAGAPGPEWKGAQRAFAGRLRGLLGIAIALGLAVSLLGILLQGASAAGVSLWASLKGPILENTLESRFGTVWGLRAIDWVLLGVLLASLRTTRSRWISPPLVLGAVYLAATPALSGHASVQSPRGVFFPSDVLHVLAASVWVGGIACLLLALPAATRTLPPSERGRLLFAVLARFSPLALGAVVAIALTGVVQAYIDVRTLEGLLHTTYGILIVVKTLLLLALIGLGWVNRERVLPALGRIAAAGSAPGGAGVLARRTLRGEFALMLAVFGVTAALIGYAPPIDAASGPVSVNTTLGPAELELTVEPARVGLNTVHLYLIDAKTGSQFTATRELTVKAALPSKGIGPLSLKVTPAGPGHYILSAADLSPGGTWELQFTDRVSEFEESTRDVKVAIR